MSITRRHFIAATAATAGFAAMPFAPARAGAARYTRYNVSSPEGQAMLKSYAVAIKKMLDLPPDHPHNWFRNAFVHFMDCPHGNWWFYVWHRGFVGFFEQTVRALSGNPNFAFPYWDWTQLPQIPDGMFEGVLTPVDDAYKPYARDLPTFTDFIRPTLARFYRSVTPRQREQLERRDFKTFELLWDGVLAKDPKTGKINLGDQAYAETAKARYLTRDNPKLDAKTAEACSQETVDGGLAPTKFYDPNIVLSFTSAKTPSHNAMPDGPGVFSVLEGQPHNKVHNFIGGVGNWGDGPFGNMTNNLSPVDPVFFLHHSNMDRLWDVWTKKQIRNKLPILPTDQEELTQFLKEPFLFFVRSDGTYVLDGKAEDYISTDRFDYDYAPVTEETGLVAAASSHPGTLKAAMANGAAKLSLSAAAQSGRIVAAITVTRSTDPTAARDYDVLVGAPADITQVDADSPYYAGTISFFGPPMAGMAHDEIFAVPLPRRVRNQIAAKTANGSANLEVRLVPTYNHGAAPPILKGVTFQTL